MGYYDLIANTIQTYRQALLFNVDNDNYAANMGMIKVYYNLLPSYLQVNGTSLTPEPSRPIMDTSVPQAQRTQKFSDTYEQEQLIWILENLMIIEEAFSKHLYVKKQLFEILQTAMQSYRQSVIFAIVKNRNYLVPQSLIKIMNVLLPLPLRAKFSELPSPKGLFSSQFIDKMNQWNLQSLNVVEQQISSYINNMMIASRH